MNYEAILFDMDGVIVDTEQTVTAFWQAIAETYKVQLTQADFDQHVYGCPATHTFDLLFPQISADERQAILEKMAEYETRLTYTEVKGAVAFLQTLRKHAFPTALVTSGDRWKVAEVTRQLGIEGIFTAQVTVNDIQKGKPHPECYLVAAQYLQKQPEHCIVFEDAVSGVKAAVASGALCIGVRPPRMAFPLLQAGVCHVVPDFTSAQLLICEDILSLQIGTDHRLPLRIPYSPRSVI